MRAARLFLLLFCFQFIFLSVSPIIFHPAEAVLSSCGASINSSTMTPSTTQSITLTISNTGSSPIIYIKIVRPSDNFTITDYQASGWNGAFGSTEGELTGGSIAPAGSFQITLSLRSGSSTTGAANLTVEASDSGDGSGKIGCTGSLGLAIEGSPPDTAAPTISNVVISDIYSTSAKVSFTTDELATSQIDYGITSGEESQVAENASLTTTHSFSLTGLTPNTTHYFYLSIWDAMRNSAQTDEVSFTTAASDAGVATTIIVTTTTTSTATATTIVITPTPAPKDTVAPSASLSTDFTDPYKEAPTIEGKANDGGTVNVGVVSIDYSLDGGKNWLPVDNINTIGKKSVTFNFTPVGLEDGNYLVKVRAKDSTGNTGQSKTYTMVIDRLPPQVGGTVFSIGPMILRPDSHGNIYSIAGLDIKATLSAVGGPITMDLILNSEKFPLLKSIESGLWSGVLKFYSTGNTKLKVNSIDGANNETERNLSSIVSLQPGKVIDQNLKPLYRANVNVYTFEKTKQDFVLWDGLPYSQTNPQETDDQGEYRLFLPPGKYFLEVEAAAKRRLRTEIFELAEATPINQNFILERGVYWGKWWSKTIPFNFSTIPTQTVSNAMVGKPVPDFDLSVSENIFNNTTILGKPTVLTFLSTWEPQSSDQLLTLDNLQSEYPGVNIIAVATQESLSKVSVFKKVGGYSLRLEADPDGLLVIPLNLESLPTHIFLDRKGIIKDVVVGFLDKENILNKILE